MIKFTNDGDLDVGNGTKPIFVLSNGRKVVAKDYTCGYCGKRSVGIAVRRWICNWCGMLNER